MTSEQIESQPRKRRLGCLGIGGIVVLAVILAVVVFILVRVFDEQRTVAQCPDVARMLIEDQLGEPSSFATVNTSPGFMMTGTATVDGTDYIWGCQIGVTRGVHMVVREGDEPSVIDEFVEL